MKTKIFLSSALLAIVLFACDKIDNPIPEGAGTAIGAGGVEFILDTTEFNLKDSTAIDSFINANSWTEKQGADNSTRRFITLEEFTGHKCTSCPQGTREIVRLQGIFNEQLIPVGIHSGQFARPNAPGSFMYTTDFRIKGEGGNEDVGTVYSDLFVVDGYPRGVVSRMGNVEPETAWESSINSILNDPPIASMGLTNYFDSINGVARTQLNIEWLLPTTESFNLQLYAIEGKIIDWQLDGAFDDPNYEHKFVLRKIINGEFGTPLKQPLVGDKQNLQFIYSLNSNWKYKNMEIVAFIFNSDRSINEVIQANSAFLK